MNEYPEGWQPLTDCPEVLYHGIPGSMPYTIACWPDIYDVMKLETADGPGGFVWLDVTCPENPSMSELLYRISANEWRLFNRRFVD